SIIYLRICPLLLRGRHSLLSLLELWPILGVNPLKKVPCGVSHLLGIVVINAKDLLRPEESVSTHIPNPTARVGQFLRLRQIRLTSPKSLLRTFALCNVLGQRHYELRYPLGARHKRDVVAHPNRTTVLTQIFFLNLKLSSFSLQQLGDERPVGFAVVLMRYIQKTKCTQLLLRITHDCLVDVIGG